MSKYKPLESYLSRLERDVVTMTFQDVEKVIGTTLPASARNYRPWWGNNPSGHVNALAWLRAGYKAEKVDMEAEHLTFRRMKSPRAQETRSSQLSEPASSPTKRTPLFGAMRGMIRIAPGTDLTEPTGETWDAESGKL